MSKKESDAQEAFMSRFFRGKGIFKPLNTGRLDQHVSCIREFAANIFFYTKNGTTIMIDAGYNYGRLREKMEWLELDPEEIGHILLTHQDTDHVGAVEEDSAHLFRHAKLYMGEIEHQYITGDRKRKVYYGLCTLPQVLLENPVQLLKDGQVFSIGDIKVECMLVPGHTWGHLVYLIDDTYLFTGDTLWFGANGGYSFLNVLAENNRQSRASLLALKEQLAARQLHPVIITGHTGYTSNFDFAFAHIDRSCNAWVKQKPMDPTAPYDAYDEEEDTRERARSQPLLSRGGDQAQTPPAPPSV